MTIHRYNKDKDKEPEGPKCANPSCGHLKESHNYKNTDECKSCMCKGFRAPEPVMTKEEKAATLALFGTLQFDIHEGNLDSITSPLAYIATTDGIKRVRKNNIFASVQPATGPQGPYEVRNGIKPLVPRLPWELFAATIAFFRHVNDKLHGSEVMVQFFYDPAGEGKWIPYVPPQTVHGGHINHEGNFDPDGKLLHVWDIHSHNTMAGYFSGTDDADESRAERFYGVIGKIDQMVPEWKFRVRTGGTFVDLPMSSVIEAPPGHRVLKVEDVALFDRTAVKGNRVSFDMPVWDIFADATFPEEWLDNVKHAHEPNPTQPDLAIVESVGGSPRSGGVTGFFRDQVKRWYNKPRHEWTEEDEKEFEEAAEHGKRRRGANFQQPDWFPEGDPYPMVYQQGQRIVYKILDTGKVLRKLPSGALVDTALTLADIRNKIIPKMGAGVVHIQYDGKEV